MANHAGAAPKMIPVNNDRPKAKANTISDGVVLMGRKCEPWKANSRSSRAAAVATRSPAMPPLIASSTLSVRASVMTCLRLAPSASRTAVCPRRAAARASCRFATLAQAISSTNPQTESRICRLRPYSSFITATPAPAGTTLITCLGSSRITSGIQLAGYPESYCIHCRNTPVRRGPIPSTEAPGRNRPIMRSHAETDWCSSSPSPSIMGSFWTGIQISGGSLSSVSPKKPAGATPITVKG